MQFSSTRPIDRTLSGPITQGQRGRGSDGNERVLRIPQISSIDRTSPSDCLVSNPGQTFGEGGNPLQRNSRCILQHQPTGQYKSVVDRISKINILMAGWLVVDRILKINILMAGWLVLWHFRLFDAKSIFM